MGRYAGISALGGTLTVLKEWAYAGMFFDLSGAVVAVLATGGVWASCRAAGGDGVAGWVMGVEAS
jgi:hypothetical protein